MDYSFLLLITWIGRETELRFTYLLPFLSDDPVIPDRPQLTQGRFYTPMMTAFSFDSRVIKSVLTDDLRKTGNNSSREEFKGSQREKTKGEN